MVVIGGKLISWDKVDLIKVAHHGSESNLIESFYKSTNPKYAIISAGDNERNSVPDEKLLKTIENETNGSTMILVTKKEDTIMIKSNGVDIFEPIFIHEKFDGNK